MAYSLEFFEHFSLIQIRFTLAHPLQISATGES